MSKLKKFDPQNRKKDQSHEMLREYRRPKDKPIQKERSGANKQRFVKLIDENEDDDIYT